MSQHGNYSKKLKDIEKSTKNPRLKNAINDRMKILDKNKIVRK